MTEASSATDSTAKGGRLGVLVTMAVAAIGGMLAWSLIDLVYPFFEFSSSGRQTPMDDPARLVVEYKNAAAAFALVGLCLGSLIGLTHGLLRGSVVRLVASVVLGAALGFGAGAGGGYLGAFLEAKIRYGSMYDMDATLRTMLTHAAAWATLGLGIGLGVSVVSLRFLPTLRGAVGGMLGGLLAAMIGCPAIALLVQREKVDQIVFGGPSSRLAMFVIAGALIALGIGPAARPTARSSPEEATPSNTGSAGSEA